MRRNIMKITFLDGNIKEFGVGTSALEIAKSISSSLAKKCVAAKVNDVVIDLNRAIEHDATLQLITQDDVEAIEVLNHSTAHLMAEAITNLYPGAKFGVGPNIETGFYYDVETDPLITEADLPRIEKEMKRIVAAGAKIVRSEVSKADALAMFKNDPYKTELIENLEDGTITLYSQGKFTDLCRGPHVVATSVIKHFKLMSLAGAYWRGDSNNPMLQRIYGVSFFSKEDLDNHLKFLEEAAKRDHRKLGKDLDLFFVSEYGPGFPFFLPKGMVVRNELENLWRKEHQKAGYQEIKTPVMLNKELWETSGHWYNYRENMYTSEIDENIFAIKPMNCPGSILVYKNALHSYKEFPMRVGELGLVHRHEFSGALHGLFRVRAFTQDDAHIFMLPDQIEQEVNGVIDLIDHFYKDIFGFEYHIELSTKPEEKAIGSDEIWEKAESALQNVLEKRGIDYVLNPGDGAFYGPKLDFKIKDAIGRTWQCGTIQLDFNLPERFDMNYIGEDGEKHRPVMVHRVVYGSIERFIGILIEHYAGKFPTWLAPVQVKVLGVNNQYHGEYAKEVMEKLKAQGIRVELDEREEKLGKKMRDAQIQKVPYTLVLGDNERDEATVTYREHGKQEQITIGFDDFVAMIKIQIADLK
ncbi:MAG: threonine--tRNA ligase [Erysipelotrichaceae bacterium]|nr:threonine--tRNA ligase [Erysipelotrichaceae bacterium]MDD3810359.1 threonine--tRNA ligase [Erysipelotrichaceae bacterium]